MEVIKLIIYKATNISNNKIYIGQTTQSLEQRSNQHLRETKSIKRNNTYFHDAIEKYGFNNFNFETIDTAENQEELDQKERFWISYYHSNNSKYGYNLDSGGRSGGTKSQQTKEKIGQTTIEKWKNKETATKMMNGLRKGTETVKNNAKQYTFTCPICGKKIPVAKWELEKKQYCSLECLGKSGKWIKGVEAAKNIVHIRNLEHKKQIKETIVDWVLNHESIVMTCPQNRIVSTLHELLEMLYDKYNIKDIRSIFTCFNVKNRKELLKELQNLIIISKENVC